MDINYSKATDGTVHLENGSWFENWDEASAYINADKENNYIEKPNTDL